MIQHHLKQNNFFTIFVENVFYFFVNGLKNAFFKEHLLIFWEPSTAI